MTIADVLKLIEIQIKELTKASNEDGSNTGSNYLLGKAHGFMDAKKILEQLESEK